LNYALEAWNKNENIGEMTVFSRERQPGLFAVFSRIDNKTGHLGI